MIESYAYGLLGGLIIGGAGVVYLLGNGRIMGASGILGSLVDGSAGSAWAERLLFVTALVAVPFVAVMLSGGAPQTHLTSNPAVIVAGGLLVGIGTRLANGCTSGHGVCGISRFSVRGIAATVAYLVGGGLSLLVFRHLLGVI